MRRKGDGIRLTQSEWQALGRLLSSSAPLLMLSWEHSGVASRLVDALYADRLEYGGMFYLRPTGIGRTAFVRWIRREITDAERELLLFRLGRKTSLRPRILQQLTTYGLVDQRHGPLTITPLGHLVAQAPPGL